MAQLPAPAEESLRPAGAVQWHATVVELGGQTGGLEQAPGPRCVGDELEVGVSIADEVAGSGLPGQVIGAFLAGHDGHRVVQHRGSAVDLLVAGDQGPVAGLRSPPAGSNYLDDGA